MDYEVDKKKIDKIRKKNKSKKDILLEYSEIEKTRPLKTNERLDRLERLENIK